MIRITIMRYISKILFMAAAALGFAACADEIIIPDEPQSGEMPVNITFSFTDKASATRSMVSGVENKVHTMQLVCFDANGLYLGIRNASVTNDNPAETGFYDTGIVKGTVPQGTARIHFIANRNLSIPLSHSVGTAEETVMQSEELSTAYNAKPFGEGKDQEVCYWGYHKEATAEAMNSWLNPATTGSSVVYMIRDRARVVLTYVPGDNPKYTVTKIEWLIHNGRERGYLAPKSADWESYTANSTKEGHTSELISTAGINEYTKCDRYSLWRSATDNEDANFDVAYQSSGEYTSKPQFLFEDGNTAIDNVKAILRVTYTVDNNSKTVYHVLRLKKNDIVQDGQTTIGELYPVVRNNTYYIECKLLNPNVAFYETLKDAIDGTDFVNAEVEIDRDITDINDANNTLQILLPTQTTSIVLNTTGNHDLDFAFRKVSDINVSGSTDPNDFEVKWEKAQTFCTDPTLTYVEATKQFMIHTTVKEGQLGDKLQDEWIVVKHKASGLTRYIHVFVINQFKFLENGMPKLEKAGDDYKLSFTLPPVTSDNADDPIYPASLYPIDIKFTTNTLNAYGTTQGTNNYGLFGVSIEETSSLTNAANFETGYNSPVSSTNYNNDRTHWYFQQADNYWDFWYTYSLKTYPANGKVEIYFKDVRDHIKYATVTDVGLFLNIKYFGKIYSIPVSTN